MHQNDWNRIFTVLFILIFVTGTIQPAATMAAPVEGARVAPVTQEEPLAAGEPLAKIEPLVLEEIAENGQTEFFVWMTDKADLSPAKNLKTKLEKGQFVFETLRATADSTQAALRTYLDAQRIEYRPFYIANKIFIYSGNESLVMSLAARSDVARISPNRQYQLEEPMINPRAPENITAIEPNISFIRAPEVWDLGFRGEGLVMAGNDTGLNWDHPAIINQYRGWDGATADHNYNWWDATGQYPDEPFDGHGHGTHTTGTMVGDDGGSNQIGVAPGAQTIHCKNLTDGGSGDDYTITICFEWDLAPWDLTGSNPMPSMAPHAINNSWGYWGGGAPQFEDEIEALQAAGIVVEASAGGNGPACSTITSPADYIQVLATGSVDHTGGELPGILSPFSGRGPSLLYPEGYKPNIVAPGVNIRSSLPGDEYAAWSGTSMSGPHSTALIALIWQAAPGLTGWIEETYEIIYSAAVPLTGQYGSNCGGDYETGPNNDWGFGTIDALAAVEEAMRLDNPYRLNVSPEAQEVCTPDGFEYTVDVLQNEPDFEEPVTLSTLGGPPDYTPSFSVNPVIPPGSSLLEFTNSGPSSHGSYSIDVLGMALTYTVTSTVSVGVFTETPGTISLTAPADGATFVDLRPTFEWTAAVQGSTYYLEVAGDPGFGTVVYEAIVSGTSHQMEAVLAPVTEYWWRVTPLNACGEGMTSGVFSFTTRDIPPILLVDDDDNSPDVRSYYTDALDGLGQFYDVWDTNNSDNEPSAFDLAPYEFVVWFTGDSFGGAAGPGAAGEAALGEWLDGGGCFLISSQDYLYDRGLTGFMQDYLGVSSFTNDVSQTSVTGAGSVFGGLGPYTLTYPFSNFSDRISPDASAELAFTGNAGDAAVNKDGGAYQSTFWGFPLEALPEAGRGETLQAVVDWCGVGGETGYIAGTVTDADYGTPIAGASVAAGGRAVLTDASGEYSMRLPVGVYDVTASAENYVPETVTGVEVLLDQTTIVDFEMEGSSLFYEPEFIEETMQVGEIMSTAVTVYNTGPLPVDFLVWIEDLSGPMAYRVSRVSILSSRDGLAFTSGSSNDNWAYAVPDSGTVDPGEEFAFEVVFDASLLDLIGTYTAHMGFSGSFVNDPPIMPLTMHVVETVYGMEVNWEDSELSGAPGEMATFEAAVTNLGNAPDTFDLTFEDNLWGVVIDPEEISLGAGASVQVSVMVYIPDDAEDGDWDEVTITVVSQGDPAVTDEAILKTTAVVVGDQPAAGFSYAPAAPVAGEEITFTNTTTGTESIIYAWDFGDGGSSTAEHPTHVYAEAGSYVLTLTATNDFGEDTFTETIVVTSVGYSIFLPVVIH
jgi:subtilisin family serine protease